MEAMNIAAVTEQNRALMAALRERDRKIAELKDVMQRHERGDRARSSTVSCLDRHWRQLEHESKVLMNVLGDTEAEVKAQGEGEEPAALGQVLLKGLDRFLFSDIGKFAAALAVNPLDDVIRFDDPSMGLPAGLGEEGEGREGDEGVDAEVRKRCDAIRSLMQRLARRLQEAAAGAVGGGGLAADLVEANRRLQSQLELTRDRLIQARRCQADLYRGLVRVVKERCQLARQLGRPVVKAEADGAAEMDNGKEGGGVANGVHPSTSDLSAKSPSGRGQKRRRSPSDEHGGEHSGECDAHGELLQEFKSLAEKRLEELERLREEKAALNLLVNKLSVPPPPVPVATDEQIRQCLLFRTTVADAEQARREREGVLKHAREVQGQLAELQAQMAMVVRSKQEAIEAERAHWMGRVEDMTRENHLLRRRLDEATLELDSRREIAKQAEEMRMLYEDQKAELERVRECGGKATAEVADLRKERQALQTKLAGVEGRLEEVSRKGMGALGLDADQARGARVAELERALDEANGEKARMSEFQTSLFDEAESLSAAYEKLSVTSERYKHQLEDKEKRNMTLMDDLMRVRASEKLQIEKTAAIERRGQAFDSLRRQQEDALKALQEQVTMLRDRVSVAEQERAAADEKLQAAQRTAHQSTRGLEETSARARQEEKKAEALTERVDDLARQLDHAEQERSRLQEELMKLNRKIQKLQSRLNRMEAQVAVVAGVGENGEGHSQGSDMLKILNCSVCNVRWKDVIISKCWHMFCRECVQENLKVRSRKCPACGKGFGQDDVHDIYLT